MASPVQNPITREPQPEKAVLVFLERPGIAPPAILHCLRVTAILSPRNGSRDSFLFIDQLADGKISLLLS